MSHIATPSHVIVTPTKSVGIGLLLTLFFGPLGLLYATVRGTLLLIGGAIVLSVVLVVVLPLLAVGSPGAGTGTNIGLGVFGLFAVFPLTWIASMVWSVVAINKHNSELLAGTRR